MAYGNYIASIPPAQVTRAQQDPDALMHPSKIEEVSHLVAYWIKVQPLGRLLKEALDGGQPISKHFTHPFRDPGYHDPNSVQRLLGSLTQAWAVASAGAQQREVEWFRADIARILNLFQHAANRSESVVSVLEPPPLEDSAPTVRLPFLLPPP